MVKAFLGAVLSTTRQNQVLSMEHHLQCNPLGFTDNTSSAMYNRIYPEALRFGQGITDIFLLAEQVHFSRGKTGRNRLWSLAQR